MERDTPLDIIECTLRDGSYAVDFQFTLEDTALITGLLAQAGFGFIEVAHGVGLDAAKAGKGAAPWTDEEVIRVAKANSGGARIGAFCIPGIATLDSLKRAADAGLDFVRIGYDAPSIEHAIPFVEEALRCGLFPFVNFMKSYAISPAVFGEKAHMLAEAGVKGAYLVDSAGGMLPQQIGEFFAEAAKRTDIRLGFHGHNNLHLAVANCLAALENGASFLDSTLYGLGRSAGNAPTEVLVSLLQKLGRPLPVDLFDLMNVTEAYIAPLICRINMYDMMAVTAGHALFHSSFLPKVAKAARKYEVDVRRLMYEVATRDPVNCPDDVLNEIAGSLPKLKPVERQEALISFSNPMFTRDHIHNTLESAVVLFQEMATAASKRRCASVLELRATPTPSPGTLLAEFVLSDNDMVLGRVTFGSEDLLADLLRGAREHISVLLVDSDGGSWCPLGDVRRLAEKVFGQEAVYCHSSRQLQETQVLDALSIASNRQGRRSLFCFGTNAFVAAVAPRLVRLFDQVVLFSPGRRQAEFGADGGAIQLNDWADWKHLQLKFGVVVLCSLPDVAELRLLLNALDEQATLFSFHVPSVSLLKELSGRPDVRIVTLDPSAAYRGQMSRWMTTGSAQGMAPPRIEA